VLFRVERETTQNNQYKTPAMQAQQQQDQQVISTRDNNPVMSFHKRQTWSVICN